MFFPLLIVSTIIIFKNYCNGKAFVLFLLKFVVLFDLSVWGHKGSDFDLSVLAHSFEGGVLSDGVIDVDGNLMDLHLKVVHFTSHLGNIFFINVDFNFVLIFCSLFLIQKHWVFWFDVGDFIIKSQEIMLQILKFKQLLL